ncbi:MAG: ATP-dependent Clp protease proteolytic subunit [Zetaproteobacteria bacterium]|nr:ATP-dependent Clp protease proteolytic subunit [Pseudobdellovibrionaceae bacterium]
MNNDLSSQLSQHARDSAMLSKRSIFISEAITSDSARKFVSDLIVLDTLSQDPITIYLNSPGGEVNSGFSIYDTIRFLESKVTIVNTGLCASIATIINVSVPKARRFSMPNARFLIHQPLISGVVQGPASDIEITAHEISKTRDRLNQILSESCEQELKRVEQDTQRDYWMSSSEAIEYGLIGKIVTQKSQIK